jgi:hypothetical protein
MNPPGHEAACQRPRGAANLLSRDSVAFLSFGQYGKGMSSHCMVDAEQ